jgi:uncharacterized protein with von Willebrand factor type A (vWA) domain
MWMAAAAGALAPSIVKEKRSALMREVFCIRAQILKRNFRCAREIARRATFVARWSRAHDCDKMPNPMFVDFLFELRRQGLRVGTQEALTLSAALQKGLHESSLDGFYDVARALLVHREEDLDRFDVAFAAYFEGVEIDAIQISDQLLAWLKETSPRRELSDEERRLLESLDLEEARRRLQERLREQKERHDGGSKWVGTGGTSPFGRGGYHPTGLSVGEAPGQRSAMARAGERRHRDLRGDLRLDVRQIELALRRLRAFVREGAPSELDLDGTIDRTAKNAGELEVVLRAERRPAVRVLLLLDVGGSMEPHIELCERLFSAARAATHFKQLEVFFFHNCVYSHLYRSPRLREGVPLVDVLGTCDPNWKLILVGDALMHPAELWQGGSGWTYEAWTEVPGIGWMDHLARHFRRTAWLNPEPEPLWRGTAQTIASLFPMFRLTLDGISDAIHHLTRGQKRVSSSPQST